LQFPQERPDCSFYFLERIRSAAIWNFTVGILSSPCTHFPTLRFPGSAVTHPCREPSSAVELHGCRSSTLPGWVFRCVRIPNVVNEVALRNSLRHRRFLPGPPPGRSFVLPQSRALTMSPSGTNIRRNKRTAQQHSVREVSRCSVSGAC